MPRWLRKPEHNMLDLVIYPPTCLERLGLWIRGEVVEIRLEEPECLFPLSAFRRFTPDIRGTHKQRSVHRFLAQVQNELLQCHRLIVNAYDKVA
jgi:hypothetical protein